MIYGTCFFRFSAHVEQYLTCDVFCSLIFLKNVLFLYHNYNRYCIFRIRRTQDVGVSGRRCASMAAYASCSLIGRWLFQHHRLVAMVMQNLYIRTILIDNGNSWTFLLIIMAAFPILLAVAPPIPEKSNAIDDQQLTAVLLRIPEFNMWLTAAGPF